MAYDSNRAAPSPEAHAAAEAADRVIEALSDGFEFTDALVAFSAAPAFTAYTFETGISKGESISRMVQVLSLVERDNRFLDQTIPEPWGAEAEADDEFTE